MILFIRYREMLYKSYSRYYFKRAQLTSTLVLKLYLQKVAFNAVNCTLEKVHDH